MLANLKKNQRLIIDICIHTCTWNNAYSNQSINPIILNAIVLRAFYSNKLDSNIYFMHGNCWCGVPAP